jgi:uncharacterized protein
MSPSAIDRRVCLAALSLALLAGAAGGGCSILPRPEPDPTRYFVLESAAPAAASAERPAPPVAVAPVTLTAGYLTSTRSLVVRRAGNEIRYEDFARWAEPLDAGVARVLRERIPGAVPLRPGRPVLAGTASAGPMIVRVEVVRCEGRLGGEGDGVAYFAATYEISDGSGGDGAVRGTFTDDARAWDGRDPARLAALLGEAVGALAAEIAARLPR